MLSEPEHQPWCPVLTLGCMVAMGVLFGGFNGGLLGLLRHLNER
jgi:hypothetical protein